MDNGDYTDVYIKWLEEEYHRLTGGGNAQRVFHQKMVSKAQSLSKSSIVSRNALTELLRDTFKF